MLCLILLFFQTKILKNRKIIAETVNFMSMSEFICKIYDSYFFKLNHHPLGGAIFIQASSHSVLECDADVFESCYSIGTGAIYFSGSTSSISKCCGIKCYSQTDNMFCLIASSTNSLFYMTCFSFCSHSSKNSAALTSHVTQSNSYENVINEVNSSFNNVDSLSCSFSGKSMDFQYTFYKCF